MRTCPVAADFQTLTFEFIPVYPILAHDRDLWVIRFSYEFMPASD